MTNVHDIKGSMFKYAQFADEVVRNLFSRDESLVKQAQENLSHFTRIFVRESSILDRLYEPKPITKEDLQINIKSQDFERIEELEPLSFGVSRGYKEGVPDATTADIRQIAIPRTFLETDKFTKSVREIEVSTIGFMQMIEENIIKDIGDKKDEFFFAVVKRCLDKLAADGMDHRVTYTGAFDLRALIALKTKLTDPKGRPYKAGKLLMNTNTLNQFAGNDVLEMGVALKDKVILEGINEPQLMGMPLETTSKTDIVPDNKVYLFAYTDENQYFFAKNYLYKDVSFVTSSIDRYLTFWADLEQFIGITNGFAVAELTVAP